MNDLDWPDDDALLALPLERPSRKRAASDEEDESVGPARRVARASSPGPPQTP